MSEHAFDPVEAGSALAEEGTALERLPFGTAVLDGTGRIVEYNAGLADSAAHGRDLVGENFFRAVAPLASLRAFEQRFADWLAGDETRVEPFEFVFPDDVPQRVGVSFVRLAGDPGRATVLVKRLPLEPGAAR